MFFAIVTGAIVAAVIGMFFEFTGVEWTQKTGLQLHFFLAFARLVDTIESWVNPSSESWTDQYLKTPEIARILVAVIVAGSGGAIGGAIVYYLTG